MLNWKNFLLSWVLSSLKLPSVTSVFPLLSATCWLAPWLLTTSLDFSEWQLALSTNKPTITWKIKKKYEQLNHFKSIIWLGKLPKRPECSRSSSCSKIKVWEWLAFYTGGKSAKWIADQSLRDMFLKFPLRFQRFCQLINSYVISIKLNHNNAKLKF